MTSTIAFIPARAGSVRVPDKNIRKLGGKPLLVWTIEAAQQAGLDDVYVSSDSERIGEIATQHGAVWIRRPEQYATAESPDIEWVQHALIWMRAREIAPDILAILRPTSPFRDAVTIKAAMARFLELAEWPPERRPDSLRAIRKATEHPAKVWSIQEDGRLYPFWAPPDLGGVPAHSCQTNTLPPAHVQTAGLELVWREAVERTGRIGGDRIHGFILDGPAALDINTKADFVAAEQFLADPLQSPVPLPPDVPGGYRLSREARKGKKA